MISPGCRSGEPGGRISFEPMITLRDLAAWESRVASIVARTEGAPEERDRALERSGVYAEYPAILSGYLELLDDEESALEAMKRAVFLIWYSGIEPAMESGIAELPELTVRATLDELEAVCRRQAYDEELQAMLAWYHQRGEHALLRVPGLNAVEALIEDAEPQAWDRVTRSPSHMAERGLLGRYWMALGSGDR